MLQSNQPIDTSRNLTHSNSRSATQLAIKGTAIPGKPTFGSNQLTNGQSNVYASIPKVYT